MVWLEHSGEKGLGMSNSIYHAADRDIVVEHVLDLVGRIIRWVESDSGAYGNIVRKRKLFDKDKIVIEQADQLWVLVGEKSSLPSEILNIDIDEQVIMYDYWVRRLMMSNDISLDPEMVDRMNSNCINVNLVQMLFVG